MAMKMIDKKDCEYKGGYIVNDGKVVCVDNKIVSLFNKFEEDVQRAQFEATKEPVCATPNDEEFMRKTEHGNIYPCVKASTPELDKKAEQTMKLLEELDQMVAADQINDYLYEIQPLIEWVHDDFIVSGEQATQHRFDLPTIGNPLELDKDTLCQWVIDMFE